LVKLKSKLSQLLDGSLPGNFADGVELLENHLREGLAERGDQLPPTLSVTTEDLKQYSGLVREIAAEFYKEQQLLNLLRFSGCDAAVAEGLALITIGCVIGPHAGLVGFGIGVYLLTQSCGEGS
jgi:hypothetical protein